MSSGKYLLQAATGYGVIHRSRCRNAEGTGVVWSLWIGDLPYRNGLLPASRFGGGGVYHDGM